MGSIQGEGPIIEGLFANEIWGDYIRVGSFSPGVGFVVGILPSCHVTSVFVYSDSDRVTLFP